MGCSSMTSGPTSPSGGGGSTALTADQIAGTLSLVSIQPAGQAEQAVPAGATYTLALADGRASTRADCNMCNGAFAVSGQTLTIGPLLACTRAACPTMDFESAYVTLLAGESAVRIDAASVALSSSRGVLRFRR